ncbi:MAG: alkaline phosphatase family protein [Nanoarchaeota archaeon]|nr:alkaline phosphatase family protein [Nanoarchaeota archaeon]
MKPKLIICIDGLGKDLVSEENTPFLYSYSKKNYISDLVTLFASTGLEYSFFSGKDPIESKIWLEFEKSDNSIFNSLLMKIFGIGRLRDYIGAYLQLKNKRTWMSGLHNIPDDKLRFFDTSAKEGLWKLDFFKNKRYVFYKWPFFVVDGKEKIILRNEKDSERLSRLLSIKNKEIYYVQIMKIDKTLHKFGKRSNKIKTALYETDELIKKSVIKFLENNPDGEIFLWSDHGFSDIKKYIDIRSSLPKRKDYLYFIGGTTVSIWFKNEDVRNEIISIIKNHKEIKILDTKKAKEYKIPFEKKYGDLIIYLEKGNYFFPNFYQEKNKGFVSMHIYPDNKELNGFLISNVKIPKKIKMKEVINFLK